MKPTVKLAVVLVSIYAAFWHFAPLSIRAKTFSLLPAWSFGPLIQQQKLTATDAATSNQFGRVVAVSGDTAIVATFGEDNSNGNDAGAAYVFVRSGGVWSQQQKLVASDGAAGDLFGFSVAIDGDTALIGAVSDDNNHGQGAGSAYIFTRSAGLWTEQQRIQASDGALNDGFGYSVSLIGDTAVISSVGDDNGGAQAGSVYVFIRNAGGWIQQQRIQATDAKAGANFGHSTSLSGDTILIGAWQDNAGPSVAGAAYVFIKSNGVWIQQQKLTAPTAASHDFFGTAVSVNGDTAIVGAPSRDEGGTDTGAAYVFTRNNGVWTHQHILHPLDPAAGDHFGSAVVLSNDAAIVGAYLKDGNGEIDVGAAYVFLKNDVLWTQQQKLIASDAAASDAFGLSLASNGNTVIVGAPDDDHSGGTNAGSVYVFVPEIPNNPPVVNAAPNQSATEDVPFNLVVSFSDADVNDTHISTINWGDGSPAQAATVTEPSGSNPGVLNASHTYLAAGSYQVTVTVTDAADATASDTLQVVVVEPVSDTYIHNTTTPQANANFNISGSGVIGGNLLVNGMLHANGSALTDLNGANITAGTIDNARLGLIPSTNIADGVVVRSLNGLTDHVNLAAGSNVTITPAGNTLTISAAGNFIVNSTTQQPASNFNISGDGVAANLTAGGTVTGNVVNATTQFNLAGNRVLSIAGADNTFAGRSAGIANSSGFQNSFFGSSSGTQNTNGYYNAFFGSFAGHNNTTGYGNSFFGDRAGMSNTSAYGNSFFGVLAGADNTALANSFFGFQAGLSNTIGDSNVFLGYNSGYSNTTGRANLFFGYMAGFGTTSGSNNILIGTNTTIAENLHFATAIGAGATVSTSNTIVLGRNGGDETVLIPGRLRLNILGTAGGTILCRNTANQIATCSSSLRYKTNIMPFSFGLNLVRHLHPITFTWKADGTKDMGFGAEDVALVDPLLVTYNAKGEVEGVKYDRISVVLVNAIKEQQAQIEAQQLQLKQQQNLINELRNLLCQKFDASVCR